MVRVGKILVIVLSILFLAYLLLPPPSNLPPLPDSVKSSEPGDTIQVPNVVAYYSNWSRKEVTDFYYRHYSRSSLLQIPLPTIRLNHPPEMARLVIRDQILTSYLEEFVHPFHGSLYVSGWEPDVYFAENQPQRNKHQIFLGETKYFSKTTLRTFQSSLVARVGMFLVTGLLVFLWWKMFQKLNKQSSQV